MLRVSIHQIQNKKAGWGGIEKKFEKIIPHQDGAGVIESVGENVDKSRIGERVWIYEAQRRKSFWHKCGIYCYIQRKSNNLTR